MSATSCEAKETQRRFQKLKRSYSENIRLRKITFVGETIVLNWRWKIIPGIREATDSRISSIEKRRVPADKGEFFYCHVNGFRRDDNLLKVRKILQPKYSRFKYVYAERIWLNEDI